METLQRLASLKEERQALVARAETYDQVITLSAVNQSSAITINTALITAMVQEAAKTRKEIEEIVSMHAGQSNTNTHTEHSTLNRT